jgi:hypothetical protein
VATQGKTRADLPQFHVLAVGQGSADENGYTERRLHGHLDRIGGLNFDPWCWLLLPGRGGLAGNFTPPTGPNHETTFSTLEKERLQVEGMSLAILGAYHQAYHIWMVEDGPAAWTEALFAASDAVAERFVGTDGHAYRRLSKASNWSPEPSARGPGEKWIVPGGWDHEHCEICNTHIDPQDRYFHHAEWNAFLCVSCYEKYVIPGSIEFALPV